MFWEAFCVPEVGPLGNVSAICSVDGSGWLTGEEKTFVPDAELFQHGFDVDVRHGLGQLLVESGGGKGYRKQFPAVEATVDTKRRDSVGGQPDGSYVAGIASYLYGPRPLPAASRWKTSRLLMRSEDSILLHEGPGISWTRLLTEQSFLRRRRQHIIFTVSVNSAKT